MTNSSLLGKVNCLTLPLNRLYFLGLQNHCGWWLQPWNKKTLTPWKKSYNKPRQHIKKQRHHFADKGLYSYGFPSSHIQMWESDHKEGWAPKHWYFHNAVLKKTLEKLLDCKEIRLVNLKRNQPWIFIGMTNAEVEAAIQYTILWPPDVKSWLTEKDPDAGKDWRKKKRGAEDEVVR